MSVSGFGWKFRLKLKWGWGGGVRFRIWIEILNEIETGVIKSEAPLACELIHQTEARKVLYMAIFLHDLAKGKGGDHSVLGSKIAEKLCPLFNFSEDETDTVKWLIRWHLLISKVAFRYDLNDPKTIENFVLSKQQQLLLF